MKEGLDEIGAKYEKGEYFLSDLVVSGEIAKAALDVHTLRSARIRLRLFPGPGASPVFRGVL
jgi:methanogenic corrinoid protein MtbC1